MTNSHWSFIWLCPVPRDMFAVRAAEQSGTLYYPNVTNMV
jgi:hypothetical protein